MTGWYVLLDFVHVASVIVWVGGLVCLTLLNWAMARAPEAGTLRQLARQTELFGRTVLGPMAALALLSGLGLVALLREGMRPWMGWGLTTIVVSIAFGATLLRRANVALATLGADAAPDPARLGRARRRLALLNTVNVALLLSAVWVMVWKPGA